MSDKAKQKMADKLDRSASSATTRTSATPSQFTFSTTPESVDSTAAPYIRVKKKKAKSNLDPAPPTPDFSTSWSQSVDIWEPELDERFAQQIEADKHSQKRTTKTSSSSLIFSTELNAVTQKSSSKKIRQYDVTSEGDSKPASSHIRKTMRKSQLERRVTRLSPTTNNIEDYQLSPREAFRAFLLQDRITQSQRDIRKPQVAQTERMTQSLREITQPTLAEKTGKRETKRSKSKREHSTGSSRVPVKPSTPPIDVSASRSRFLPQDRITQSEREIKKPQVEQREKMTQSLRETRKPPLAEKTEMRETKRSKSKREHSTGSSSASLKPPTPPIDVSAGRSRFLPQDRITQSQRDVRRPQVAQRERMAQSLREMRKPPLAEKTEKQETKRSKSKREHSTGSSRAPMNPSTPPIDVSASRSRLLKKKHRPVSKLDTSHAQLLHTATITPSPSLHSVFEWNRSPISNEESKEPVHRRKSSHGTPTSEGLVDRRRLMRKAHSTSDIYQYHVTPEWPFQKRNTKLHSLFYDLSVRRKTTEKGSPGLPLVSAKAMLSIMEPCSRREILTVQGKELEPPLYREDFLFDYGDVIDGISQTSTQATK